LLELLEEERKEAEQQHVRTERSKDPTLMAARQAREREIEHEQVRAAAPEADRDGRKRDGVQRPDVQRQVAPISVNHW
jgi:hypothetical protein